MIRKVWGFRLVRYDIKPEANYIQPWHLLASTKGETNPRVMTLYYYPVHPGLLRCTHLCVAILYTLVDYPVQGRFSG